MDLNKLRDTALAIAEKNGWNKNSSSNKHYICLVISELMEAVEADREGLHTDLVTFKYIIEDDLRERHLSGKEYEESFINNFETFVKDRFEDELADAFIRLLHLAGLNDIDLGKKITSVYKVNTYNIFTEWVYDVTQDLFDSDVREVVLNGLGHIWGYCQSNYIDLESHIINKMEYNELRGVKAKRY